MTSMTSVVNLPRVSLPGIRIGSQFCCAAAVADGWGMVVIDMSASGAGWLHCCITRPAAASCPAEACEFVACVQTGGRVLVIGSGATGDRPGISWISRKASLRRGCREQLNEGRSVDEISCCALGGTLGSSKFQSGWVFSDDIRLLTGPGDESQTCCLSSTPTSLDSLGLGTGAEGARL